MGCGNRLLAVLVLVQCSAVLCYSDSYYESKRTKYDIYYRPRSTTEMLIYAAISAAINVFLLGLLFVFIKYCCPTCCRTVRPGYIIGDAAALTVQYQRPPPSYYPNAPPPEAVQLFDQPTLMNQQQHRNQLYPVQALPRAGFVQPP